MFCNNHASSKDTFDNDISSFEAAIQEIITALTQP